MGDAIRIGGKQVRRDGPPFVVAEIGVNHNGEESQGINLIEAAAAATCDAVKFQLFRAELLLAREAGLVDYQKESAGSAGELLKGLEMSAEVMGRLIGRAHELGMGAIVTPFSPELVAACKEMGADAIKLASPDLVNRPLVEEVCAMGLPMIVSTGAAELAEVERTVGWLYKFGAADRAILLHCVSSYPTAAEQATLGAIGVLRERFKDVPVGYSDHTEETFTAAMAVGIGACFLEKHLTLDRKAAGPDHAASLEPGAMAEYCALAKIGYAMRGGFEKRVLEEERGVREQTRQSVVVRGNLKVGTVLTREMLVVKRPGTGVPAAEMERVVGRVLVRDVVGNSVMTWADVGGRGDGKTAFSTTRCPLKTAKGRSSPRMCFLIYKAVPVPANNELNKYGGAHIACWVNTRNRSTARKRAKALIESAKWSAKAVIEEKIISAEDYREKEDGLQYFDQALIDGEVCVILTYPRRQKRQGKK